MLRLRPRCDFCLRLCDRDEDRELDARHSPHVEPQLGRGNCADWKLRAVTDWIKLAALSFLFQPPSPPPPALQSGGGS